MLELTDKIETILAREVQKIGHYSEYGAVIGDCEFILVYKNTKKYLAHISEFETKGILVKLKKENE